MFNEIDAIKSLKEKFRSTSSDVYLGIGDDCAAIKAGENKLLLISTDSLVEGVHFTTSYFKPLEIAEKSVAVSISDIASMGGSPRYILSTIGIPQCSEQEVVEELLEGIKSACSRYGVELIGGNITGSEKLFLDITAIGEIDEDKVVKRCGSRPGDLVFVTGNLGDSALGLKLLESGRKGPDIVNCHKVPLARIEVGKKLAEGKLASSMIDISDGLIIDLERITVEHNLGARLYTENIPLSDNYRSLISEFEQDAFKLALTGGEDYELLFTSPPEAREEVKGIEDSLYIRITEIGVVTEEKKIELIDKRGNFLNYEDKGYIHLR